MWVLKVGTGLGWMVRQPGKRQQRSLISKKNVYNGISKTVYTGQLFFLQTRLRMLVTKLLQK